MLEFVSTTRHFTLLSETAHIGGAGSISLDAHVKEIDSRFNKAMTKFLSSVKNLLSIDGSQAFETAFFAFRSIVKVGQLKKLTMRTISAAVLWRYSIIQTNVICTVWYFSFSLYFKHYIYHVTCNIFLFHYCVSIIMIL